MKSNCLFIFIFLKQFLSDSIEEEDYLAQMRMPNGNITDIYSANMYENIKGIQDAKSDDYYKQIANFDTYNTIEVTKKKTKSRKLLDQPVYLYKQLHLKTKKEISQFRADIRQTRQDNINYHKQQSQQSTKLSEQFNTGRNLLLLSREKQIKPQSQLNMKQIKTKKFEDFKKPQERNLRLKKRKLTMPPMVIMFGPHMYTPEINSPQMRINLGENKILYDEAKKAEKSEPIAKVKNTFSVNSPDYMPMGRGLSTIDIRKKWKLFQRKFLIQII